MNVKFVLATLAITTGLSTAALADQTNGFGVGTSASTSDFLTLTRSVSAFRTGQDSSFNYTRMGDTPSERFVSGCEQEIINGSFCSGGGSGTSGGDYNLKSSASSATLTNEVGRGNRSLLTSSAFARSSLETGELGVNSISDYRHGGQGVAQFADTLNFIIAGASAATSTNITVQFTLDGSLDTSAGGSASIRDILHFGNATADLTYNAGNGGDPFIFSQRNWVSYSWTEPNPLFTTFTGVFALTGASQSLGLFHFLSGAAGNSGKSLYGSTSALQLILPAQVSYTSNSGVFLSGGTNPGGVPEPASWAMLLIGFGVIGTAMRRRSMAPTIVSA